MPCVNDNVAKILRIFVAASYNNRGGTLPSTASDTCHRGAMQASFGHCRPGGKATAFRIAWDMAKHAFWHTCLLPLRTPAAYRDGGCQPPSVVSRCCATANATSS